jgi:Domain of unknown function (DUF4337)
MSEIHETIEKAQEGEHSQYFNRRIALLIAVLALFLSFSETFGKSAQTEAISANVEASDLWAFFRGALRFRAVDRRGPQGARRARQRGRSKTRPRIGEISSL